MFLQSVGLLPDNVLILSTSREKSEERVKDKLSQLNHLNINSIIKQSIDESELNLSAVREIYKGFYCEINCLGKKNADVIDEIAVSEIFYYK